MLDMSRWCEGRYCSYAAMQLPAVRTRRLPGEMAAAVCRVQVALCLGGFLLHAAKSNSYRLPVQTSSDKGVTSDA